MRTTYVLKSRCNFQQFLNVRRVAFIFITLNSLDVRLPDRLNRRLTYLSKWRKEFKARLPHTTIIIFIIKKWIITYVCLSSWLAYPTLVSKIVKLVYRIYTNISFFNVNNISCIYFCIVLFRNHMLLILRKRRYTKKEILIKIKNLAVFFRRLQVSLSKQEKKFFHLFKFTNFFMIQSKYPTWENGKLEMLHNSRFCKKHSF